MSALKRFVKSPCSRLVIPIAVSLLACEPSAPSVTFAAGQCYSLVRGAWSPPIVPAEDSVFHRLPPAFRLTADTLESSTVLRVRPDIVVPSVTRQIGHWSVSSRGDLVMSWGDGFTGVGIQLRPQGDSLIGMARLSTDNDYSSYHNAKASAAARRIDCNSIDSTWGVSALRPGANR